MPKTAVVTARIEPDLKQDAENVLSQIGLTMSQAMSIYLRQVVYQKGIPFSVTIPNQETIEAIEESKRPQDLPAFATVADLFDDLGV